MMKQIMCMAALGTIGSLMAATVTIAPGNGVETNVTTRFTGETDIVVNSGTTGGGIVTLANPLSTHTGTTTVNSGTLVVPDGDIAKGRSCIGASGPIVLGAGTLRASGVLGAVVTNTYPASSKLATVLDVQDELHITNDFVQKTGTFIKTGPGTVYFSGANNRFGYDPGVANGSNTDKSTNLIFNVNGDAPTKGLRGNVVIAEGTMVIEGGYNYFNGQCNGSVGTWTTNEGTEKSAVLEFRGGTNVLYKCFWPGWCNGFSGTTGGPGVRSGIRVTGGVVSNGVVWGSSGDTIFMGGKSDNRPAGRTYDTYPFIEVLGGHFAMAKNLQLGNLAGVHSTFTVAGTGVVTMGQYIGVGYEEGPSVCEMTLADNGDVTTQYLGCYGANSTFNINLLGGTLTTTAGMPFQRNKSSAKVNVLLDGGTLVNGYTRAQSMTNIVSTLASVRVGTRGFTFAGAKNANQHQKEGYFQKSIVYTNTHPDEVRQPIDFKSPDDSHRSYYTFGKNCTIDAPVRVWPSSYLLLDQGSDVVGGNPLLLGNTSRLRLKGGNHTVDTVSFGFTGTSGGYNTLMIASNTTLVVTREVLHPGSSYLNVYLYNVNLENISGGALPGVYTLIAAPAASYDVLASLVSTAKFANQADDEVTAFRFQAVMENGQAKLQLVVLANSVSSLAQNAWSNDTGDGLWKTDGNWGGGTAVNGVDAEAVFSKDAPAGGETVTLAGQASAGGIAFSGANGYTVTGGELLLGGDAVISSVAPMTNTIASTLTATAQVAVNPAQTGGGVVKLTGDLSGLAGGVFVNSGTLEVNDTSFVTDASKLEIGRGTFAYAGADPIELSGLLAASVAPAAGVLRVDAPITLRSAESYGNALLVKTGPETLTLKGAGPFALSGVVQPPANWSGSGAKIGASGDGPTGGLYGFTVREGRFVIGTVGDASDAPTVTAFSFAAGGQPLEGRPPAEIVMNNGTATLLGALKVDGYVGGAATNRLVVNGGTINVGNYIGTGLALRSTGDPISMGVIEINGGELSSPAKAISMIDRDNELEIFLNEGGVLRSAGFSGGTASVPGGVFHANGGTYKPINIEGTIYARYFRHFYLGERGLVVDTTDGRAAYGEPCNLHFAPLLERDPALPAGVRDGGIRVRGSGILYFGSVFANDGTSGDIVVEDGATLMARLTTGVGPLVRVLPGGTLRSYQTSADTRTLFVDSLVLGEAGATKPVRFEVQSTTGRTFNDCVVSNDFAVAGPVLFATRANWYDTALASATGVYTAFVYRAACDADVDVAKFALDPAMSPLTADFTKVDVTLGGESGWRALVATVRKAASFAEMPHWTATRTGGNWSDSGNWSDATPPNASGAVANFAAAEAAGVPVTLDAAATVGQVLFEATTAGNGYTLGGANALTFALGDGNKLLDVAAGGKVTVNAPVRADGTLCINAAQSAATRGTAGEVVFGADALTGFTGTLYPRSGRVTIPSLAWMTDASQLWLGFGTVKYTGTGETIPGFVYAPTGAYMATLEIENDLTVMGRTTMGQDGAFMKAGAGTLYLKGEGNYRLGNNNNNSYYWGNPSEAGRPENNLCANGDSPVNATMNLSVGAGKIVVGETNDATAGPTVYTSAYLAIGVPAGGDADAEFEINSGTFEVQKYNLYVGYYHGLNNPVRAKLTVNGGAVSVRQQLIMEYGQASTCSPEVEVNGGTLDVGDSISMSAGQASRNVAMSSDSTSTFTVNGGVVTVQTNFFVVHRDSDSQRANNGRLYLNGGELDVKGTMYVTRNSHQNTKAQAWLNPGGLLKAGNLTATRTGGTFYFNGGTFLPYGALPDGTVKPLAASSLDILVTTNGAVIGTSNAKGGQYAIAAALKHDPALAGKDGGLVKTGAGTLVLSGANTYTGPTVVDQGTLAVSAAAPLTDDTVVRAGALLDLGGARTLANLTGDGTVWGDLTLAGALTPRNGIPTVDGDFATTSTATVDFDCTGNEVVNYGTKHLVLRVTGTVDANVKFKAVNGGQPCMLTTTVEDGLVYVTTKSGGTLLLFR